jgi:hypothetical protein
MSGGSFNYLYSRPDLGELGSASDYSAMAAGLASGGHYEAATLTLLIAVHLEDATRLAKLLADVHRAEEWRVSGDYGPDKVTAAAAKLHELLLRLGER